MMYEKNDVQKLEQWLAVNWYLGYEMESMTRTRSGIILRFRSEKHPECYALVQQHAIPYVGIGAVKITEYRNGDVMGTMTC